MLSLSPFLSVYLHKARMWNQQACTSFLGTIASNSGKCRIIYLYQTDVSRDGVCWHLQRSLSTSFPPHSVASIAFTESTVSRLSGSLEHTHTLHYVICLFHFNIKQENVEVNKLNSQKHSLPSKRSTVTSLKLPVNGSQYEFNQQHGALSGVDSVCGGQALAELVEQGGHQVLQPGHRNAGIQLHSVQTSVPHRLDHIVNVDQMHLNENEWWGVESISIASNIYSFNNLILKESSCDSQLHLFCINLSLQAVRYVERQMASRFCSPETKKKRLRSSTMSLCISKGKKSPGSW